MNARRRLGIAALAVACITTAPARAQEPDAAALARDPVLFLRTAEQALGWHEPAEPVRIAGPIYFVGTKGLAVYLITTSQGHILLNTGMPDSGPMIAKSMRKLGFRPEDVKLLLVGHAHIDHVGAHAWFQKLSQARVAAMAEEVALLESGGEADFHYGEHAEFAFEPVKAGRVLRDGEILQLGDVAIEALLTPGHTRGSTTYVAHVTAGGKAYTVVFPNGTSVNPGYRLVKEPSYPGIADDYRRTFHRLEMLKPDIWLDAHTGPFDFAGKRARAAREGVAAWVDPEGYRKWVVKTRATFEAAVEREMGER